MLAVDPQKAVVLKRLLSSKLQCKHTKYNNSTYNPSIQPTKYRKSTYNPSHRTA